MLGYLWISCTNENCYINNYQIHLQILKYRLSQGLYQHMHSERNRFRKYLHSLFLLSHLSNSCILQFSHSYFSSVGPNSYRCIHSQRHINYHTHMSGLGDPNTPPICSCPHYFSKYSPTSTCICILLLASFSASQNPFCPPMEGRAGNLLT